MYCPKCKNVSLQPTKLEADLSAAGCSNCGGALVSLLYYRDWAEGHGQPLEHPEGKLQEAEDTKTALTCPKCGKLMTKFHIDGATENRLDLCGSCDEAWLDKGEWALLKALELANKMPLVFTDEWQRRVRQQSMEASRQERLSALVGEETSQAVEAFRQQIKDHPHKQEILVYLAKS